MQKKNLDTSSSAGTTTLRLNAGDWALYASERDLHKSRMLYVIGELFMERVICMPERMTKKLVFFFFFFLH